jgi:nucleoside-diphosphate-sugar epimerase
MAERRTAIVAGAFGAVGRTLVEHLEALGGWEVVGIGRRAAAPTARARYLQLDLADPAACARASHELPAADVVFFAAYAPRPSPAEEVAPNLAMLSNLMEAVEPRSPTLRRVVLLQGSKWYGSHLGPYKTPADEDDPRLPVPSFYYAQQDWLAERGRGRDWSWSALRPHAVLGFATGSAMSLLNVLGVYGAICRELGRPMDFPGKPGAFASLYQMTDARLLARALVWAATEPACADRAFNITNGDLVRWRHLWPRIAAALDAEPGPVRTMLLSEAMADKEPLWREMVRRHGLRAHALSEVAGWRFGDFVFHSDHDHISNLTRARKAGWCESLDTGEALVELLRGLRAQRIIP